MFSQRQLDGVRRRALEAAARRLPKAEMRGGDGRVIREVPYEALLQARANGESLKDEGYWSDMDRRYPEIVVPVTRRAAMVSLAGPGPGPGAGRRVRTRYGIGVRYG